MKVRRIRIRDFRGFATLDLTLRGAHCLLVGEPGAGRSDLIEGLSRVLSPDSLRSSTPDELDFHNRDLTQQPRVEVTLGDLGETLEHTFFDQLELWDPVARDVVEELADAAQMDAAGYENVVRICYRALWSPEDEAGSHFVHFSKTSNPETGEFDRLRRAHRDALAFVRLRPSTRALELGPGHVFRGLVESSAGDDLATAIDALVAALEKSADTFAASQQVQAAVAAILDPIRSGLSRGADPAAVTLGFTVEGGSLSEVLRALEPALGLPSDMLRLPLTRHGSSALTAIRVAQAVAAASRPGAVVAIDDFGEDLDGSATESLAAVLAQASNQLFLSTRRAAAARAFESDELVRLGRDAQRRRQAFTPRPVQTKKERSMARHLALQLLPAITARTLVIVEGPNDRAGYSALWRRLWQEADHSLLADQGAALIDAGDTSGSGGAGRIPQLAEMARDLGFRVVAVIDGDPGKQAAVEAIQTAAAANAVVRLPTGSAIEKALIDALDENDLRTAMVEACTQHGATFDGTLAGANLVKVAVSTMKNQQLHAQFVDALPAGVVPELGCRVIDTITDAVGGTDGLIEL